MYLYWPKSTEVAHGVDERVTVRETEKVLKQYKLCVLDVRG